MIEAYLLRALVVAGLVGGAWYWADSRAVARTEEKYAAAAAVAAAKARQLEAGWQSNTRALQESKDEELRKVGAQRDAALLSLRKRAKQRLPEAAQSACAGASPAALARPDAAVALGFAAEFDQLRAEYRACRSWVEVVTQP